MVAEIITTQIAKFVSDYSIETTPDAVASGNTPIGLLPTGANIYIAHPPRSNLAEVTKAAITIQNLGYNAVPHLVARKLKSVDELQSTLMLLEDSNVSRILVVAGDQADPKRVFDSTLEVFYTGMLERFGFKEIGFAGHPEGNRRIGASILKQAMLEKLTYAAQSPSEFYILTQFGFDSEAVITFDKNLKSIGMQLPIHVGMAGKTKLRRLLMYAARCGVKSSLSLLTDRSDIIKGMVTSTPDGLIRKFSEYQLAEPECQFSKAHFFAFGSFDETAIWANAIRENRFSCSKDGENFEIY